MATNGAAVVPSSPDAGPSQSPRKATSALSTSPARDHRSPRSSLDRTRAAGDADEGDDDDDDDASPEDRIARLEDELAQTRQEKEALGNQYRSLLGKLTAMRTSLGDKLREDAEELDRRESTITTLQTESAAMQESLDNVRAELVHANNEAASLSAQLAQLRNQSDSSSSDVLSLTREMRELRGEMERLRIEREEWEVEAGRERERREAAEEEMAAMERRDMEAQREYERGREQAAAEKERADNLQEVLSEFQAAKDSELRQATHELETQLRSAATALSEYKLRAANAETRLGELGNDVSKSASLSKELKEKQQTIAKLRHEAVVNNEHLTEALRRLRKNSSDNNVDRRLVTNILLSFLTTHRADSKRFEMLSLLSTILSWDDNEREKAGLQRSGNTGKAGSKPVSEKGKARAKNERSAEEEAAMNESFSNLFVEFLLKEASQGQGRASVSSPSDPSSPMRSPPPQGSGMSSWSPTGSGANTPQGRPRGFSNSSSASGYGQMPPPMGRNSSWGLQQALSGDRGGQQGQYPQQQ